MYLEYAVTNLSCHKYMKNLEYQIIIDLKNNIYASLKDIKKKFNEVDDAASKVGKTTERVNGICQKLSQIQFAAVFDMIDRAGQALASLGAPGMAFEQSMADLSSITGITGKELEELGKTARATGKETGLGAAEAANAYAILASQIDVSKIGMEGLQLLQKETITLAQASGMSMVDAANSLAGTINQFGMSAEEANRVINVLAAGSKYGAAEIPELAQSFKVVGAAANAAGLDVEATAGALEVLSKNNLKGAEAGTALRNILLKLQTTMNVDFSKTSLATALDALKPKLTDAAYLSKLFGMENVAAAQFMIANTSALEEMTDRVTATNVAQEQAAIRTETTAHKMEVARAKIDDLKVGFHDLTGSFSPYVTLLGECTPALSGLASMMVLLVKTVKVATAAHVLEKAAIVTKTVALGVATVATNVLTMATRALNVAMKSNPIGLIVGLLATAAASYFAFGESVDEASGAQENFNEKQREGQQILGNVKGLEQTFSVIKSLNKRQLEDFRTNAEAEYKSLEDVQVKITASLRGEYASRKKIIQDEHESIKNYQVNNERKSAEEAEKIAGRLTANKLHRLDEWLKEEIKARHGISAAEIAENKNKLKSYIATSTGILNELEKQGGKVVETETLYGRIEKQVKAIQEEIATLRPGEEGRLGTLNKQLESLKKQKEQLDNMGVKTDFTPGEIKPVELQVSREFIPLKATDSKGQEIKMNFDLATPAKYVEIMTNVQKSMGKATEMSKIFGNENTLLADQMQIVKEGITVLINEGFSAGDPVVQALVGTYENLSARMAEISENRVTNFVSGLDTISSAMQNLSGVVGSGAAAWLNWGSSLLRAIAQAIPAIIAMTQTRIAAAQAEVTANTAVAATGAAASVSSIPFVGVAMAIAAVAGILALLASVPKPKNFANGGIVYGETFARVGEYPGAANNPEVIAPLSKLKNMLQPAGISGNVSFTIEGDKLVGILKKANNDRKYM